MKGEPFELKCIKREIDKVKSSSFPVGLTKITIHTSDAIWLVRQVEKLQKIANAWSDFQRKGKESPNENIGNLLDIKV
jgi:hypothetical protein